MRKILAEIQDGTFTRELVEEFDAGQPNFLKRREAEQAEQIEQVGAKLAPADELAQRGRVTSAATVSRDCSTYTEVRVRLYGINH